MLSRMKFVVPLRIPPARSMVSVLRARQRFCRIGMAPPQAALKMNERFFLLAISSRSIPWAATRALLEEMRLFPASRHLEVKE